MLEYFHEAIGTAWFFIQSIFVVYAIGLALEGFFAKAENDQPISHVAFNIQYTFVFVLLSALLMPGFQYAGKALRDMAGGGLIHLETPNDTIGMVLGTIIYIVIFDFFYYWWHRLQHSPFMWPQHEFHHVDRSVNVTTGIRHHWLEEPLRVFFLWLPMNVIFDMKVITLPQFFILLSLWGFFTHLNVRLNMGILTPVFAGPQLHRIHHSIHESHLNKNFAAYLPIYDVLFGTYYKPAKNEFPATGVVGREKINHLVMSSISPFIGWYKSLFKAAPAESERLTR